MNTQLSPKIAIIIPVFCEEKNLQALYARIQGVISKLSKYQWTYIFINDASTDRSFDVISTLAEGDSRIVAIDFSRNFGKEIALSAGARYAKNAQAVICMDADLQHPPELIPKMIELWESGAQIVATVRTGIDQQPFLRKLGSKIYYWLMARISGLDMVSQTTDFRLYDQDVIKVFNTMTERNRLFRGIMDWLGFEKAYLPFHAEARLAGVATYSYKKLWNLAVNSLMAFSLWPLRIIGYLGVAIIFLCGILIFWMIFRTIFFDGVGYTPLAIVVVVNTFLIGIVLAGIGLVALYIGSIHTEVTNRPLYIVRKCIGVSDIERNNL